MEGIQLTLSKTLSLPNLVKAKYSSGRINVPVDPNHSLYARFKHVKGVPSGKNGRGVSIVKLKTLDTLIDRLAKMKKDVEVPRNFTSLSQGEVDSLLRKIEEQYRSTLTADNLPYKNIGLKETGVLFSLFA